VIEGREKEPGRNRQIARLISQRPLRPAPFRRDSRPGTPLLVAQAPSLCRPLRQQFVVVTSEAFTVGLLTRFDRLALQQFRNLFVDGLQTRRELEFAHGPLCLGKAGGNLVHLAGDEARLLTVDGQLA